MYYLVETGKRCLAARKKMARGTTDAELSGFIAKSLCKSLLFRWILKAGVKCTHEPGRTSTVQAERHTMLDNVIHSKFKINKRTLQLKPTRRCSVLHVDFFYFRQTTQSLKAMKMRERGYMLVGAAARTVPICWRRTILGISLWESHRPIV